MQFDSSIKKVLVIVAHPDDETIWCGGLLLRNKKNWNTTILSLCRKTDLDRAPKFFKVCEEYNAKGVMSDLDDDRPEQDLPTLNEVTKRISSLINEKKFDLLLTHGKTGEYGHKRHIETHNAVVKMLKQKIIFAKKVLFFSYKVKGKNSYCVTNKKASTLVKLSMEEAAMKKFIIMNKYGFSKDGFEEKSCSDTESFDEVID